MIDSGPRVWLALLPLPLLQEDLITAI